MQVVISFCITGLQLISHMLVAPISLPYSLDNKLTSEMYKIKHIILMVPTAITMESAGPSHVTTYIQLTRL